ncbi:S-layer homology domain-containing protein [Lutibacter sp. B2]|nr:S-layer homology domain-containing protein [Lutibacter sp. B2]
MNYFMKKNWKNQISKVLLIVILATILVPILPSLNGFEDNRVVAAEVYEDDKTVTDEVYTMYDKLATKAAQNNMNLYKNGKSVGSYDVYILKEAEVNVTSWVYDETSLKDSVIHIAEEVIKDPNKKKIDWQGNEVNAYSAKEIGYAYLAMNGVKETDKATDLLNILKDRQEKSENGSFDNDQFSDMVAFESLGRAKIIKEINIKDAIKYILGQQNDAGAWGFGDFQTTAQAVRSLLYLKEYATDKNTVQESIDQGIEWIKGKQQEDGSFTVSSVWSGLTYWDDKVIDTSEAIYILKLLNEDLNSWTKNGKGPVDYMTNDALNEDETFGSGKKNTDNTWALDVYLMLGGIVHIKDDGDNTGGGTEVEGNRVYISIKGYDGTILSRTEVELKNNDTVFTVTKRELDSRGISYSIKDDDYFVSINGQIEKRKGQKSGWMFNVDGQTTGSGSDSEKLYGGENVEWFYTLDFTTDSRNTNNDNNEPKDELDKQIDAAKDVLNNENASESEVTKAVKDITDQLNKKADEIKSQEEAKNFVKDTKDIMKVMEIALNNIKTEDGAKDLANESVNIVKYLFKTVEKLTKDEEQKYLDQAVAENMEITLKAMDKIKDMNHVRKIAGDMIEAADKIMNKIGKENSKEIQNKIVTIAQKSVVLAGTQKIEKDEMKIEGNKAVVTVDAKNIKDLSKQVEKTIIELSKKLENNNIAITKIVEKKISIEIPHTEKEEIETNLPSNMMDTLKENGIEKVEIKTEVASFNVTPKTFGDNANDKEISLSAKKIDRNKLSALAKNKIPEDSPIIDLNARVGQEKISKFEEPIEISIPYEGKVKEEKAIKVFFLKDNGMIEEVGGEYDSVIKTIKFKTNHFSKYFAKEVDEKVRKVFKDLKGYDWAKEAIETMASNGMINGREKGLFDPSASITRAEFATLVTTILDYSDVEKEIPFTDAKKDDWYYNVVVKAYENGLINGRSNTIFDPQGKITREEMAVIIGKVLEKKGYKNAQDSELNLFTDEEDISDWAKKSVSLTVQSKIMSGMGDGIFAPKENANRAQATVMLYNLYKK